MSCSKIFLGDLPELIYNIVKNFQNDYSTLLSCVLVNRLWCRLVIPLLCENPFSILTGNYNFIEIYSYNLNDCLKAKLNEYQIIDYLLSLKTLFNYPGFLRYLSLSNITFSIERWVEANDITSKFSNRYPKSLIEFEGLIEIYCNDILELILQNPNFINNTRNLKASIFGSNTIIDLIPQIIMSHQNLKRLSLYHLVYSELSLYQSFCITNLARVFEKLNVLESVHIIYCYSSINFIQQIINVTKPFKLKSLFISVSSQIDSLQSILQKSGSYLENFGYVTYNNNQLLLQLLLELIIKYCRNVKCLDLYKIDTHIASQTFGLIENIKQNLNYLSIRVENYYQDSNIISIKLILQNLGQTLPSKLEYLEYSNNIDILSYIKEYIMLKRRVKYLAIRNTSTSIYNGECIDLSDLKDEVKEFKLHNINVVSYNNLHTNIHTYVINEN
ncbi:hypothetical protein C1646_769816 [Rhizophagus diaphanus]|nr:hypothetical protein C1646_769816 [Rhizophagus diaphanus] [Rhizophagus sp. MUCL 43196]